METNYCIDNPECLTLPLQGDIDAVLSRTGCIVRCAKVKAENLTAIISTAHVVVTNY